MNLVYRKAGHSWGRADNQTVVLWRRPDLLEVCAVASGRLIEYLRLPQRERASSVVIGPDGTCKVCGRAAPNWGDERKRGLVEPDEPAAPEPGPAERPAADAAPPAEWHERKLCSDGSCVGVIGDDGKCKVCGRSAT